MSVIPSHALFAGGGWRSLKEPEGSPEQPVAGRDRSSIPEAESCHMCVGLSFRNKRFYRFLMQWLMYVCTLPLSFSALQTRENGRKPSLPQQLDMRRRCTCRCRILYFERLSPPPIPSSGFFCPFPLWGHCSYLLARLRGYCIRPK